MVDARVAELQLKRQVDRADEHATFLQRMADEGETRLLRAEADLVDATRDHEHRQMLWEEREDSLEDRIAAMESEREQHREEARALLKTFDADFVWMPGRLHGHVVVAHRRERCTVDLHTETHIHTHT